MESCSRYFGCIVPRILQSIALLAFIVSIYLILQRQFWIQALGSISPFTLGAVCALYLSAEYSLSHNRVGRVESIVLAVLFSNTFMLSFELIYHFTFPIYWNYFRPPFLGGEEVRYFTERGVMFLPLLLLRRYLSLKKVSAAVLTVFMLVWVIWILYGFPQYHAEGYFYPTLLKTNDPWNLSLLCNFGSKTILALFFASLLDLQAIKAALAAVVKLLKQNTLDMISQQIWHRLPP